MVDSGNPFGNTSSRRHGFAPTEVLAAPEAVPYVWQRWAAAQLMSGGLVQQVAEQLVQHGFAESEAHSLCVDLAAHPAVEAGRWGAERLAKLQSVLDMRQEFRDLSRVGSEVQRRRGVSPQDFFDDYYSANLPVVLTDVTTGWDAVRNWSPSFLGKVLGSEEVEVMTGREADDRFEINAMRHKSVMPFSEYVAHVQSASWSNDEYLVANNHFLERQSALPLWSDFSIDGRYLDGQKTKGTIFLWFGPGGTVTPLHHDVTNVLFVQVYGRKLLRLISPLESHCVYNDVGVFSEVDAAQPDLARHPRFARTRQFKVLMEPGDALFIPIGWWHHVTALDTSISLSFTNFHWRNSFTFHNPYIRYD